MSKVITIKQLKKLLEYELKNYDDFSSTYYKGVQDGKITQLKALIELAKKQ